MTSVTSCAAASCHPAGTCSHWTSARSSFLHSTTIHRALNRTATNRPFYLKHPFYISARSFHHLVKRVDFKPTYSLDIDSSINAVQRLSSPPR
ncbi:hypothetical protein BDR05DRAFT_792590 [Suillus weaverae]|nr:hypothetical protein BDR05DRAFT_792590 [Suillus weaverae]